MWHLHSIREPKHKLAYRWLRGLPDHVIAVSEQVRRHAIAEDRMPPERVSVVYNGVDAPPAEPARVSPATPLIVTVGNLRRVKGHDTLVEAAARRHQGRLGLVNDPLDLALNDPDDGAADAVTRTADDR